MARPDDPSGGHDEAAVGRVMNALKLGGKIAARPMVESMLREKVVFLLRKHDPDKIEQFIQVNYPLVAKQMPQNYKNAIANAGPHFEEEIQQYARPDQVLHWLEHPEEWMDVDEHSQKAADVRECYRIITTTPGGRDWLERQCIEVWRIARIL